ncbi:MAG TPA: NAD(P)H-hydrate epimerase [Bacteroidales bacterium]|nr:NAD(P)H-hydrate epimerase [Bacteroidales bacterium]
MKIFRCDQIREIDSFTISNEPIASADLMERAALQLFSWLAARFERTVRFIIFAGPGNNGGDGLALARLLFSNRYHCEVHYVKFSEHESDDWKHNRERLLKETDVKFNILDEADKFPLIDANDVIIDALLGSGLTRPAEGLAAEIIRHINHTSTVVVSVDIPSGLPGEANSGKTNDKIIKADYTLSFQFPKLSFMFPENAVYTGEWIILPIGLSPEAVRNISSPWELTVKEGVLPLLKRRNRFDHKGIYGHGLLMAGSRGKMGAAVLGAG